MSEPDVRPPDEPSDRPTRVDAGARRGHPRGPHPAPRLQPVSAPLGLPTYRTSRVRVRHAAGLRRRARRSRRRATATAASTTRRPMPSRSAWPRSRRTVSTARSRRSRSPPAWPRSPRCCSRCAAPARTSSRPPRSTAGRTACSHHVLARFGVDATFVDMTDLDAVRDAIRDDDRGRVGRDDRQPDDRRHRPRRPRGDLP